VGVSFKLEARSWKQNQRGLRAEHTTTGAGVRAKRVWVELALSWKLEAGSKTSAAWGLSTRLPALE